MLIPTAKTNGFEHNDEAVIKYSNSTLDKIRAVAQKDGTALPFTYLNYAWGTQDPIISYGVVNKKALQEAARKCDPEGFFQKGVPRSWKLFP